MRSKHLAEIIVKAPYPMTQQHATRNTILGVLKIAPKPSRLRHCKAVWLVGWFYLTLPGLGRVEKLPVPGRDRIALTQSHNLALRWWAKIFEFLAILVIYKLDLTFCLRCSLPSVAFSPKYFFFCLRNLLLLPHNIKLLLLPIK